MQKSSGIKKVWKNFKWKILSKMWKRVNAAVLTSRRSVLKAIQKTKNSWHAVTDQGKKKKKRIVQVSSERVQGVEKI